MVLDDAEIDNVIEEQGHGWFAVLMRMLVVQVLPISVLCVLTACSEVGLWPSPSG